MSVVAICAGMFCRGAEVAAMTAQRLERRLVDDRQLVEMAAGEGRLGGETLKRALLAKSSIFDHFGHERETAISQLNLAAAKLVRAGDLVLFGLASYLIPKELPQVLRVCLIADTAFRIQTAEAEAGLSSKEARRRILKSDQAVTRWAEHLRGMDPWQTDLYDMLLPMGSKTPEEATQLICRHASADMFEVTSKEAQAAADYLLAARVQLGLAKKGHFIRASAQDGKVTIEVNKRVMRFNRLAEELEGLARGMEGVASLEVRPGPGSHQADIYRAQDFKTPGKVLLVDDERAFVETLSERLLMRDMNAAVAYDGQQALEIVDREVPEVMVLDLMMPGIDGMEVLRRIKRDHPQVEVIVLTGHGTTQDRESCLASGAFAFLQKPVDISELSEVMTRAYSHFKESAPAAEEDD